MEQTRQTNSVLDTMNKTNKVNFRGFEINLAFDFGSEERRTTKSRKVEVFVYKFCYLFACNSVSHDCVFYSNQEI